LDLSLQLTRLKLILIPSQSTEMDISIAAGLVGTFAHVLPTLTCLLSVLKENSQGVDEVKSYNG